jgi:hypothetical protein
VKTDQTRALKGKGFALDPPKAQGLWKPKDFKGSAFDGVKGQRPRLAIFATHGDYRIRTDDPLLAKQVLYQLS